MSSADIRDNNAWIPKIYRTFDLHLSAYLRANGIVLLKTEAPRKKVSFIFEDNGEVGKPAADYFNNGPIGCIDFKNYIREIKAIVHSRRDLSGS